LLLVPFKDFKELLVLIVTAFSLENDVLEIVEGGLYLKLSAVLVSLPLNIATRF
jgi:hypothetical protein